MELKVALVNALAEENVHMPRQASKGAAGFDLSACLEKPITILPGERVVVPTGIALQVTGTTVPIVMYLFGRSGMAKNHGVSLANCVGVIDQDYRGEVGAILINHGNDGYTVNPGDRIAQMVVTPVLIPPVKIDGLDDTDRGTSGFGSTGS